MEGTLQRDDARGIISIRSCNPTFRGAWRPRSLSSSPSTSYKLSFDVRRRHGPRRLLRQRNGHQNPAHHVLGLEVLLRAVGMRIMTTHTGL